VSRPPGPTRSEAVRGVTDELTAVGVESPRLEAERLVAHALGVERHALVVSAAERLSAEQAVRLARAVVRRIGGEPLQHIEGTVAFRELVLVSDRRAFIPRPETEQLVSLVAEWAGDRAPLSLALDIGTGSGAIALALLSEGVVERVVGLDLSEDALRQAAENRERAGIDPSAFELRSVGGGLWGAVAAEERYALIVSNPPYVAEDEVEGLPVEIRRHEPTVALSGGRNGLDLAVEITDGASRHLRPGGALFLELGTGQAEAVAARLREGRVWERVEILEDLTGRARFVRAIR